MSKKPRLNLSTTQTIMLSFLLAILVGSLLLTLPVSSADGHAVPYMDALFTATTSICVTGLVTVPTYSTWSLFGQIVILLMVQIGGLGIVTMMSWLMIRLHRKIGLKDRMLIQDAFNLNTLSGMVKFIRKVITGTLLIESIGALLYMTVFVPEFGIKGVWFSLFNAVSAFCNAGMDIIGENSLCDYVHDPVVNLVTILLIVFGGIGYIVWWDLVTALKNLRRQKLKCFANLTLHSKIALSVTGLLILAGTAAVFAFEYHNPLTIGNFSLFDKLQASLFQSVTTRTAGFATIPQENLTNASAIISLFLMFIGGSPVGTAGGIKTVTFAVLITSAFATIKSRSEAELFHRTLSKQAVSKAVAVVCMAFLILFTATLLLAAVTDADALDIVYETASAAATVGLTRSLTPALNLPGRIIIIVTMYLGRVGPLSLMIALNTKRETKNIIKNPIEDISVG
ncbi:MAG: TrkH family potassium uptake protein [Bacteroidales bacterium]|nr:TrkH family potassium uptake protein [Bacteroidales bacterium]MCM1414741.1 TrkH family potassium uptake protein [bacterium]MCM1422550.1 TrkH family potassium uptake protein [bacterium]